MSNVWADRVQETSATTGTGTITLAGATTQFQTFAAGVGSANTCDYCILSGDGTSWEVGNGTVGGSGPYTLARTTVYASTNSNAAVSLAGTSTVFLTLSAHTISTFGSGGGGDSDTYTYPTISSTSFTLNGTPFFPSTTTFAVADGNSYRLRAVLKREVAGDTVAILWVNSAKTAAYRLAYQSDGNIVWYYDTASASTVLKAAGSATFPAQAQWVVCEGIISFGTAYNTLEVRGAYLPPLSDLNMLVTGASIYVAAGVATEGTDIKKFLVDQIS